VKVWPAEKWQQMAKGKVAVPIKLAVKVAQDWKKKVRTLALIQFGRWLATRVETHMNP